MCGCDSDMNILDEALPEGQEGLTMEVILVGE